MPETITTLLINAIATPVLVLITMWLNRSISSGERRDNRDDGFIADMKKRLDSLEREIKEVRIELKHKNAEYLALYTQHTELKAKYEVLQADHEELKAKYENTASELAKLGTV